MKRCREVLALLLALTMLLSTAVFAAETPAGEKLDYGDGSSWAYFALGEDTGIDVFLVCPTVDTRSETNSFDLNDKLKGRFVSALDMEKGIYEEAGRLYSPYYRQMSINAYRLPQEEQAQAEAVAYGDVSDAFRWYLDHENGGRGLILAGFSQGSQMCLELMKEYFGGEGAEAAALREKLVAVYALGWTVTEEMTEAYPQIVPAAGETDTGTVVAFDCEDGSLTETMIIPAGTKALSINPLNWRTDGAEADRSLNLGAVMGAGAAPVEALCGAYIGGRGELVVTGVSPSDYPPGLDIFPEGSYHLYDYQFFFMNLKENVAARAAAWRSGLPFKDVAANAWYVPAVKAALESGRMTGTSPSAFSPDLALTRAQLVTILWRMEGEPVVNYALPYGDVKADAWYAEAVRWAVSSALVEGGGSFGPKDAVTREETARILWSYAKSTGADVSVGEDTNILSYADAFDITEGYHAPLQWALGSGVMEGTPEGYLEPQGQLTRAQAAAMLQRLDGALVPPAPLSLWASDAPAAMALGTSPESLMPPSAITGMPVPRRALAAS